MTVEEFYREVKAILPEGSDFMIQIAVHSNGTGISIQWQVFGTGLLPNKNYLSEMSQDPEAVLAGLRVKFGHTLAELGDPSSIGQGQTWHERIEAE